MPTPHISAQPGEIAPLLLMPGDPRRAARIAETFLTDAKLVSEVRGNGCGTGTHEGTPMSVMASGMGIPTLSIYATELYRDYGVQRICRVGTCGGISSKVKVRDVVIGSSAHTNSQVATIDAPGLSLSLAASFRHAAGCRSTRLAPRAIWAAPPCTWGRCSSSDFFYSSRTDIMAALDRLGTLGVEMEAAGLYKCALENRSGGTDGADGVGSPQGRVGRPLVPGARDPLPGGVEHRRSRPHGLTKPALTETCPDKLKAPESIRSRGFVAGVGFEPT